MSKKILVNGITLEGANLIPLLLKVKYWQSREKNDISILGNQNLKKQIDDQDIIKEEYKFIEIFCTKKIQKKRDLIFEGLRRNLKLIKKVKLYSDFDVVYSISSVLDLIVFPFFSKMAIKKIKWVTVFDNKVYFIDPGSKLIRFLAWSFFQISLVFLKRADKIFVISQDLKNFLMRRGFKENKLVLTGNAVEIDLIRKTRKDDKYTIDGLFVGRINETKGIYDMLKVLEIVKQKYPNFQLAIMGRGDVITERQYKAKIKEMNLENNIQFLGYKTGTEKFNIIKSSKCFLFLSESESESFGIALLEAVCCGLKCFAYNLKPYKNIYLNNEVMLFERNDYKSIAKKVIELFSQKEFKNTKGELLIDKYNWDRIAEIELNSF